MPSVPHASNGHRRRTLTHRLKCEGRPCHICGLAIDPQAKGAEAFNCDELVPRAAGGSPYDYNNVDAAHACCNNWRSTKSLEFVHMVQASVLQEFGQWKCPQEFVSHAKAIERAHRSKKKICARPTPSCKW